MSHYPRRPPQDPESFADWYEYQIRLARENGERQPATAPRVARKYEAELERVREVAEREMRDYLIKTFYEGSDLTQGEVADLVGLSQSSVSKILGNTPPETHLSAFRGAHSD